MSASWNDAGRTRRRNRITRRDAQWVGGLSVASAVLASGAHCRPTGVPVPDLLWTALLAATVTWASATAAWWALACTTLLLVVVAPEPVWLAAASVAFAIALTMGTREWAAGPVRCLIGFVVIQAAIRLDLAPFGRSSLVAGIEALVLVVSGVSRRRATIRRRVQRVAVIGAAVSALAAVTSVAANALGARPMVRAERSVSNGLGAIRRGDPGSAAIAFDRAAASLLQAERWLNSPLAAPGRLVPVLAQHARALRQLTVAAHGGAKIVAASVRMVDPAAIRFTRGAVSVDAIAQLAVPLRQSRDAVATLVHTIDRAASPWIVGPVRHRLRQVRMLAESARKQGDVGLRAARVAASMLGLDGPRTYLIAFVSPAESRAVGGFLGNFAEVVAVDGALTVTRFGRTIDLIGGVDTAHLPVITHPTDYLSRYGRFGATTRNGAADPEFWDNVGMSPDLPSVAKVMAQLYPRSGGTTIDGVITIDPEGLRALLGLTGPITAPKAHVTLSRANIVPFLLTDQYLRFPANDPARADALNEVAALTLEALLTGGGPTPDRLSTWLAPALRSAHIQLWSSVASDESDLRDLGVSGEMPTPDGDGFAVTVSNAAPNKIDAYLTKAIRYDAVLDPVSGQIHAKITVVLTNGVPTTALPAIVVGNAVGAPSRTNIAYVTVFSPLKLGAARVDGNDMPWVPEHERGWNTYSRFVRIAAGRSTTIEMLLDGRIPLRRGYTLTVRPQPAASVEGIAVDVHTSAGEPVLVRRQRLDATIRLSGALP